MIQCRVPARPPKLYVFPWSNERSMLAAFALNYKVMGRSTHTLLSHENSVREFRNFGEAISIFINFSVIRFSILLSCNNEFNHNSLIRNQSKLSSMKEMSISRTSFLYIIYVSLYSNRFTFNKGIEKKPQIFNV